jgi:hypothetical protein
MQAYTNVKTTIKSSVTGEEHMTHGPIKTEMFLPKSQQTIKSKVD